MWEYCSTNGPGTLLAYGCGLASDDWPIVTDSGYELVFDGMPFGFLSGGQVVFNADDGSILRWQYCQNDCQTGN